MSSDHISNNTKRASKKLYETLRKSQVSSGPCNLISMNPPGKYNINSKTLEEILPLYYEISKEIKMSLAEIPKDTSYLKVDVDLESEIKPKSNKRLYTFKQIIELTDIFRTSACEFLNLDKNDKIAYVMEKSKIDSRDGKYRDGFHIAFPYIIQTSKIRNAILDKVYEYLEKSNIFNKSDLSINKIIDRQASVGKTPWLLLGSSKPNSSPYNVSMVLDYKNKKIKFKNSTDVVELLSLLNEELIMDNCNKLKDGISMDDIEKKYQKVSHKLTGSLSLPSQTDEMIIARILVKMLSKERASNYDDWIRVGYCLYNIDRTLLNEWIEFSKLCPSKFKKGECESKWRRMRTGQNMLTIRSLHRWARDDNFLEYNTFKQQEYNNLFRSSLTGDHQNIANAIYSKYQTDFICASIKNKIWYQFNSFSHKWEQIEQGYTLTKKITDEFVNEYIALNQEYYQKAAQASPSEKMDLMKEAEKVNGLICRINNESFLSTLMNALARRFYVPGFLEQLDENYDLIGFNNGVFDLKKGEFRDGLPEDFITMTTGLDYQPLDLESEEFKTVINLFESIHPDDDTREYVYTLLSTFVSGHHKEETLHLFNGCGSNGKSVTFELMKYCFGDYFMSVPVTLLTRKRGATESASPMLAQLKGKRLGVLQEPEEGEKLSVGLMKELTGNDEITARPLFSEPITFKPQIKFTIPCNNLPDVPARDKVTWRRLRVIDHVIEFVDKPDPKNSNQKKIDRSLKDKLEFLAPQFLSFLIDRYINKYKKEGMSVPNSVSFATNMYNQDNNCLKQFCENKLETTGKKTDKISQRTLWDEFKQYHKDEHEKSKRPHQKELYAYLDTTYGKAINGRGGKCYSGIVFAGDDDIDESVDI